MDFQFFYEEHHDYNEEFNSEGEGSPYLEKEEEEGNKDMVDADLDWIAQGPLSLPNYLHKMPKHPEKSISKFDPDKKTKVEGHIDDFYMHLQNLVVLFYDVACRLFPYTLEGRASLWYKRLSTNSICN